MPIKWKYQVLDVNFRFWDDICKSNTNMKKILTILALACSLIASAQVKTDGSKTRIDRDETNISNKMDLYRYCKKEGIGLFDGFEQSFLAYMAYLILKGRCTDLFKKYPETAETAKKISLPSTAIDMSEKKQREYKQLLTEYSFA